MNGHRSNGPSFKPRLTICDAILTNKKWFADDASVLGDQFDGAKARERSKITVELLQRRARRHHRAGDAAVAIRYETLATKLSSCGRQKRCGSLACTECAPAIQKAKYEGQVELIERLLADNPGKQLVMATLIPLRSRYAPDQLDELEIRADNRWLKDNLRRAGFRREMFGSYDLSWEDGEFYQGHWHIPMLTLNREKLTQRLKAIFPASDIVKRPVVVSRTYSDGYLPYKDKAIKLPDLLRRNRRGLPQLLLALDRTDPLELMVLMRLRVRAQNGELKFRPIR
jgi:hypothetical protein